MTVSNRFLRSKGLSLAVIVIIALSSMTVTIPNASAAGGAAPSTYNVNWQKGTPKEKSNWTWSDIEWLYGPSISMNVSLLNGTSLIASGGSLPTHYLNIGQQFYANITLPKSMLELGRNASSIEFDMGKSAGYGLPNGTYLDLWSASIHLTYHTQYTGEHENKPTELWTCESHFENHTPATMGGPPFAPMSQNAIFKLNVNACSFVETADYYSARFRGELNCSTLAISGNFYCGCSARDNKGGWILSREEYQLVLIEPDPAIYGAGSAYCRAYVADMHGMRTGYAGINTQFEVVGELWIGKPSSIKNICIYLEPPVGYGFWSIPNSENTHNLNMTKQIWTNGWFFNYTSWNYQIGSHDLWGSRRIRLTWNTTGIGIDEGYLYEPNYTAADRNSYVMPFEVNYTGNSYFYELDKTASDSDLSDGRIGFVVKIPNSANASAGTYGGSFGEVAGYTIGGTRLDGWFEQFQVLGNNVVVARLLKESSNNPTLRITPGKYFRAALEITGTPYFRNAITSQTTNITFTFTSPDVDKWWTIGSKDYIGHWNLIFHVTLNSLEGNRTIVQVYNNTYGGYYDRATFVSNYTSPTQVVVDDWWNYVQTSPESNYTMSFNSSTNVLFVVLNFTFKPSPNLPDGYYSWSFDVGNESCGSYASCGDVNLHCQKLTIPASASILVGRASWWGWSGVEQTWKVDPKTGALDLDGNDLTTNDQFFVKHIYESTSWLWKNSTQMIVDLDWAQYNLRSYFALINTSWGYEWNDYYVWYYPNNMSQVPMSRFDALINSTIWDSEDGAMKPEYDHIGPLCINNTWDKVQAEYSTCPWWQPVYKWTWLEIGFNQNFYTPTQSGYQSNNLDFHYAGILLYKDPSGNGTLNMGFAGGNTSAGDVTHYFMFENAEGMKFTTPLSGDNGTTSVNVNDSVSWGVSVNKMNGTLYPTTAGGREGFQGCDYWWHDCFSSSYVPEGNFSTLPSKVGIDNLNFTAHFSIPHANLTAGALNEVKIKVDEAVGSWNLYNYTQNQLKNYSMAIAFVTRSLSWSYMQFETVNGAAVSTDTDSIASDFYNITSSNVKIANIQMGGVNYTWGYDNSEQATHSSTTPMSAFTEMYSSTTMNKGNASVCSFSVTGENYFVTSSFSKWDGYSVRSDPYFAIYTVANTQAPIGPLLILVGCVVVGVVVVIVVVRKRRSLKKEDSSVRGKSKAPVQVEK